MLGPAKPDAATMASEQNAKPTLTSLCVSVTIMDHATDIRTMYRIRANIVSDCSLHLSAGWSDVSCSVKSLWLDKKISDSNCYFRNERF